MFDRRILDTLKELSFSQGPLCVGLDTDTSHIPPYIIDTVGSSSEAVFLYNREIIRRVASEKVASCFKVQVAFYEALGVEGMKVYSETLKLIHEAGYISIADIKRGDIDSTAAAYLEAHFTGDFEADIITVNPYMGFDTLTPYALYFKKRCDKAAFILLLTSNSGAKDLEEQELKNGERLYERVGEEIERLNKMLKKDSDDLLGAFGAVVGATGESDAVYQREKHPNIFFLIPGYGTQGGSLSVIHTLLSRAGGVVNSSRSILSAWKHDPKLKEKRANKSLTIADIADSAFAKAEKSKTELQKLQR